jgi:hypothetical protein
LLLFRIIRGTLFDICPRIRPETIFKDDDDPALEMLDVDVGKVRIKRKTDRDLLEGVLCTGSSLSQWPSDPVGW